MTRELYSRQNIFFLIKCSLICLKSHLKPKKEIVPNLYEQVKLSYVTAVVPDLFEHDCTLCTTTGYLETIIWSSLL
jgi:hypothetical protein